MQNHEEGTYVIQPIKARMLDLSVISVTHSNRQYVPKVKITNNQLYKINKKRNQKIPAKSICHSSNTTLLQKEICGKAAKQIQIHVQTEKTEGNKEGRAKSKIQESFLITQEQFSEKEPTKKQASYGRSDRKVKNQNPGNLQFTVFRSAELSSRKINRNRMSTIQINGDDIKNQELVAGQNTIISKEKLSAERIPNSLMGFKLTTPKQKIMGMKQKSPGQEMRFSRTPDKSANRKNMDFSTRKWSKSVSKKCHTSEFKRNPHLLNMKPSFQTNTRTKYPPHLNFGVFSAEAQENNQIQTKNFFKEFHEYENRSSRGFQFKGEKIEGYLMNYPMHLAQRIYTPNRLMKRVIFSSKSPYKKSSPQK